MAGKFRSRKCFPSICKIYEELGRIKLIFGISMERGVEWCRPCEILEKCRAAPPWGSQEKTIGAVAPASACA